jgi:adenosylhomocysteine nucleosidase
VSFNVSLPGAIEGSVLFVAALGWEAATIVPAIEGRVVSRQGHFTLWKGRGGSGPHWLLRVGIGSDRAAQGMRWALDVVRPAAVASTGCAGALAGGIEVGDVVVADSVVDGGGVRRATSAEWRERYRRASMAAGLVVRVGRILTAERTLLDPESKTRAAQASRAVAVEMEGAAIADCCSAKGIEFSAARVILDPATTALAADLPAVLTAEGYVSASALVRALARRPGLLRELFALRSAMRTCRRALGRLHRELIRELH